MVRTSKGAAFGCLTAAWGEPWRLYPADSGEWAAQLLIVSILWFLFVWFPCLACAKRTKSFQMQSSRELAAAELQPATCTQTDTQIHHTHHTPTHAPHTQHADDSSSILDEVILEVQGAEPPPADIIAALNAHAERRRADGGGGGGQQRKRGPLWW